jgi:hypothetical protein
VRVPPSFEGTPRAVPDTTDGGDVALLFLFFFCSAAFTAEIAVATA